MMKAVCKKALFIMLLGVILGERSFILTLEKPSKRVQQPQLITFSYDQITLKDILTEFAELREVSLIYAEPNMLAMKLTFNAGKKITVLEAWDMLIQILDSAGYTLILRNPTTYYVTTNQKALKEALPLYVNCNWHSLPDNYEKIRYVYYANSKQLAGKQLTELTTILTNIFSATNFAERVIFDTHYQTIIFSAPSELIKIGMQIIELFDQPDAKDMIEILSLEYARASEVASILTHMIGGDGTSGTGYVSLVSGNQKARYFSGGAKVINMDPKNVQKLNSLVIIGSADDIKNIKNFITKYLDIPQQKGKSFFHVVELDWVQAEKLVTVLNSLVTGGSSSGTSGQSTSSNSESALAFDPQIKIIDQTITQGVPAATNTQQSNGVSGGNADIQAVPNTVQRGGNRIICAALDRDWERIKALIEKVDVPRKQVVIECLVLDLALEFIRRLATQLRTRGLVPSIFPNYMQAQAGLVMANIIETDSSGNPVSLTGDLSQILAGSISAPIGGFTPPDTSLSNNGQVPWNSQSFSPTGTPPTGATSPSAVVTTPAGLNGSSIFMISGQNETSGVWSFFQLLSMHKSSKILIRPIILASNNQQASVQSTNVKNLAGGVSAGSTNPTVNYELSPAAISLSFTPIISANNLVNVQLQFKLDNWLDPVDATDGTKVTRNIATNLSLRNGDVIIIGGLTQETVSRSRVSIPILDRIPIVGAFVANRYKSTNRDQLFILLRATVIEPRKEGGMGSVTKQASSYAMRQLEEYEDNFSALRDPITRWFFNEGFDQSSDHVNHKIQDMHEIRKESDNSSEEMINQTAEFFDQPAHINSSVNVSWFSGDEPSIVADKAKREEQLDSLGKKLYQSVNPFNPVSMSLQ